MAEQNTDKTSNVQSIDRAFDILEYLSAAGTGSGCRLTEISEQIGLHKSTVHRILAAMQERGYVERDDKKYKLGLRFIHLSSQLLNSIELKTEAEPFLRHLSTETGLTVFLAIREGDEVVYIDKVEQFNSFRRYSIIGTRVPLYCTSLGRALLFDENEDTLRTIFNGMRLKAMTDKTITDKKALLRKIGELKSRGWSEDIEEHECGVRCVGAPVYDYRKKIAAAISTVWNIKKTEVDPYETGMLVKQTADAISERLGWI